MGKVHMDFYTSGRNGYATVTKPTSVHRYESTGTNDPTQFPHGVKSSSKRATEQMRAELNDESDVSSSSEFVEPASTAGQQQQQDHVSEEEGQQLAAIFSPG